MLLEPAVILFRDLAVVLLRMQLPRDQLVVDEAPGALLDLTVRIGKRVGGHGRRIWLAASHPSTSRRHSPSSAMKASAMSAIRLNPSGMSERWWLVTIVTSRVGHVYAVVPQ